MNEEMRTMMQNPWMKWGVIASVGFLATFLAMQTLSLLRAYPFIGGSVPATNTITVSGEGETFAVPDIATFTFSVIEEAPTVEVAQQNAAEAVNAAIDYLKSSGVDEKDIKTLSYNVYPRYEYRRQTNGTSAALYPDGTRELVGFEVSQTIMVKVRDTQKAGELLSGVGSKGASNISGLQFTIDDEDALIASARKQAIDDAKAKAQQLADDLGVRLVRVVSFNEYGGGPVYYAQYGVGGAADEAVRTAAPSVPTGENKITANVSVTYEIR
jgi:uncharacterized protein YggE